MYGHGCVRLHATCTSRPIIASLPVRPFSSLNPSTIHYTVAGIRSVAHSPSNAYTYYHSTTRTNNTCSAENQTIAPTSTPLSPHHRTHLIFGSNTDVGKTLVAAGLVRASLRAPASVSSSQQPFVHYVKPLQCGGSDASFIREHAAAAAATAEPHLQDENHPLRISTLFSWTTPASPHVASRLEDKPVADQQVRTAVQTALQEHYHHSANNHTTTVQWIETAGGVLSPAAASPANNYHRSSSAVVPTAATAWGWTVQADLYAQCCLYAPVVLVGDGRLGGISSTLTAYEALVQRGYDVATIVVLDDTSAATEEDGISGRSNAEAIREHIEQQQQQQRPSSSPSVVALPAIPPDPAVPLHDWFATETDEIFANLNHVLALQWQGQVSDWRELVQHGRKDSSVLWLDDDEVPIVDSTHPCTVSVLLPEPLRLMEWKTGSGMASSTNAIRHGRFGAKDATESSAIPTAAIHLAQHLVASQTVSTNKNNTTTSNNNTADDTSTAMSPGHRVLFTAGAAPALEAALRMGIRTYQERMGLTTVEERDAVQWIVATQEDAWHGGDTLGLLSAAENYVERDHPWYQPRAVCLAPPRLAYRNGKLTVILPEGMQHQQVGEEDGVVVFESVPKALDTSMRSLTKLFSLYKEMIEMQWLVKEHSSGLKIASVLMEPLLQFDTMQWIDPLWQRAMMESAASRNIPVIFDETRVGSFRLGHASLQMIVGKKPDITVCSTPRSSMGAVVTNNEVFTACEDQAFGSHMNGSVCEEELNRRLALERLYKAQPKRDRCLFDGTTLKGISELERVSDVFSFGSIVSIRLAEMEDTASTEDAATALVQRLRIERGLFLLQSGDCVFLDVSPFTQHKDLEQCAELLMSELL